MRLLLIADTHVPQRATDLPPEVWQAVDDADLVVHAGDWVSLDLLDRLEARADVLGCWGNNDHGTEFRKRLPEVGRRTVEGLNVAVVHETGDKRHREAFCDRTFPETDLLVFGHSHVPWDSSTPGGMRLLNPGSCIDRRMQPYCTYITLELRDGTIGDPVLHRLGA
ncbi:MAG: phosphodiesterase, family [Frankiales bacterium]|nr:phosphodiesterase, family [Frankiales bacterium]